MTKKQKEQAIKRARKELGLEKNTGFTVKELEQMAYMTNTQMIEVMSYLRYGRIL